MSIDTIAAVNEFHQDELTILADAYADSREDAEIQRLNEEFDAMEAYDRHNRREVIASKLAIMDYLETYLDITGRWE